MVLNVFNFVKYDTFHAKWAFLQVSTSKIAKVIAKTSFQQQQKKIKKNYKSLPTIFFFQKRIIYIDKKNFKKSWKFNFQKSIFFFFQKLAFFFILNTQFAHLTGNLPPFPFPARITVNPLGWNSRPTGEFTTFTWFSRNHRHSTGAELSSMLYHWKPSKTSLAPPF